MEISQLNEDEAVNILKTMCTDNFCIEQLKAKQAIETILDLYKKEKENRRMAEHYYEELTTGQVKSAQLLKNYISKDKIKAKIKSLEEKIHVVIPNEYNKIEVMNEFKNEGAVDVLNELLEED